MSESETKATKKRARRGSGSVYRRGRVWWIQYPRKGKKDRVREATEAKSKTEAGDILRTRLEEIATGRGSDPRYTVAEAVADYMARLRLKKGEGAEKSARTKLRVVLELLGAVRCRDLTKESLEKYEKERLTLIGNSTVNREIDYLRAALKRAVKAGRLGRVPDRDKLEEPPPRQGFWSSKGELDRFLSALPDDDLRDAVEAGFWLGWRRSELFGLRWEWVDMAASPDPEVRIPTTKNGEPRIIPLVGVLRELFERRKQRRAFKRGDGSTALSALVFHRQGERIGEERTAWARALKAAELPRRIWHDFRRTAARNLIVSGVPEKVAMEVTGHKTASIFRRYHIVATADRARALRDTMARVTAAEPAPTNVRQLPKRKAGK